MEFFELLFKLGIRLDYVIFVGVFFVCIYSGLVEKGIEYFNLIKDVYGFILILEYYVCLIDLLS